MFLLALASVAPAVSAEVTFEGFYRGRLRAFDTLSLTRDEGVTEGFAGWGEHRLWLRPGFKFSSDVSMFAEVRGLDGVRWGQEPAFYQTWVAQNAPTVFEYGLNAPTSELDETSPLLDLTLWRVWGEVTTDYGRFSFGRMPMHWGSGIWLNDGVSTDREFANYGDTTDRIQWDALIRQEFFLRVGADVPSERLIGAEDDTMAADLSLAYRAEDLTAGLLARIDHSGPREQTVAPLDVFTLDAAGDLHLGKLHAAAEVVGQFGGGDISTDINDAAITTFGAVLDADMDLGPVAVALRGGLATGDAFPSDFNYKTFTFDRDYSLGLFLFEQPMPVIATPEAAANEENQGREYDDTVTGEAISNALFLRPTVSREVVEGLTVSGSWIGARTARAPKLAGVNQSRSYGNEFQLAARYSGIQHFDTALRLAAFLPGSVYSVEQNGTTPTRYSEPVFGGQLQMRVEF